MRNVSVSELKAHLSQYLHEVRRGGEVQILDRGVPVARLAGLSSPGDDPIEEHRQHLVRSGLLRLRTADMAAFLKANPLPVTGDISGALDEDREDRT